MSDFEYIIQQVKKFHYSGWNDEELRKCVDMLPGLTREQQVSLFRSKWIEHEKTLKEAIFNLLFKDRIEERDKKIKAMNVDELIENLHDELVADGGEAVVDNIDVERAVLLDG